MPCGPGRAQFQRQFNPAHRADQWVVRSSGSQAANIDSITPWSNQKTESGVGCAWNPRILSARGRNNRRVRGFARKSRAARDNNYGVANLSTTGARQISAIIRNRSTNPVDVRAALHGLNLRPDNPRRWLRLWFMTEAVVPRVRPDADSLAWTPARQRATVLSTPAPPAARALVCRRLHAEYFGRTHFDLVLASYVLYFFGATAGSRACWLRMGC